jgi:hypothetical protein
MQAQSAFDRSGLAALIRDDSPGWILMHLDWSARAEHARGGVRWITAICAGMRRLARWLRASPALSKRLQ